MRRKESMTAMELTVQLLIYGNRNIMQRVSCLFFVCFYLYGLFAQENVLYDSSADTLARRAAHFGLYVPQETAYLHLDNTCYFVGDTIWYKGYVMRADCGMLTDISRILYVELLTPDGYLVERQQLEMPDGTACGAFVLTDSLYSGYYELRAYTRWMLNFGRYEHAHRRKAEDMFYNKRMAKDFFRDYDKLYSRVFPVYDKPAAEGMYVKDMTLRPLRRYFRDRQKKPELDVRFYPEGGSLVAGTTQRVAFEANTSEGEHLDVTLSVRDGDGREVAVATPEHRGRGVFTLSDVASSRYKAVFSHGGYDYSFDLPEPEADGCVMTVTQDSMRICVVLQASHITPEGLGLQVMHGGVSRIFRRVELDADGHATLEVPVGELPTGVNQLVLFDGSGRVYSDRLVFVAHDGWSRPRVEVDGIRGSYAPFDSITFRLKCDSLKGASVRASLSVRDRVTDEPLYDNGTMLTEMLLSSELKGFVENPGYYFKADDEPRRHALDLLMLVQGWRRYVWREMSGMEPFALSFSPERQQALMGSVNDVYSLYGEGNMVTGRVVLDFLGKRGDNTMYNTVESLYTLQELYGNEIGKGKMKKSPHVVASYVQGRFTYDCTQDTEKGSFHMPTPEIYGDYFLMLSAMDEDASPANLRKNRSKDFHDETAYPAYYVKLDRFFPRFPKPYSHYQTVSMKNGAEEHPDTASQNSFYDRTLPSVTVKSRRNGLRKWDAGKPVMVYDAYEAFNLAADWGLNCGIHDWRTFSRQLAMLLVGDMGVERNYYIQERFDGTPVEPRINRSLEQTGTPHLTTVPTTGIVTVPTQDGYAYVKRNREVYRYLRNLDKIYLYTDYAPREEGSWRYKGDNQPDVVIDYHRFPNDGVRHTFRDRYCQLRGYSVCEDFYSPDYSTRPLPGTKDFRRTLLWLPEVQFDENGKAEIRLYNNGKHTGISVELEGITADGKPVVWKTPVSADRKAGTPVGF